MEGEEGVISLYKSQANSISKDITLKLLTNSGGRLLEDGKLQEAIGIFKFIVSEDPAFSYGYEGLGEAYMKIGDRENAIKNYQKSLDLNPENNKAKEMLEKLGKR
jgi:tetratricopeptide (TPR) repeat protein